MRVEHPILDIHFDVPDSEVDSWKASGWVTPPQPKPEPSHRRHVHAAKDAESGPTELIAPTEGD